MQFFFCSLLKRDYSVAMISCNDYYSSLAELIGLIHSDFSCLNEGGVNDCVH